MTIDRIFPLQMVISHSQVKLPEGTSWHVWHHVRSIVNQAGADGYFRLPLWRGDLLGSLDSTTWNNSSWLFNSYRWYETTPTTEVAHRAYIKFTYILYTNNKKYLNINIYIYIYIYIQLAFSPRLDSWDGDGERERDIYIYIYRWLHINIYIYIYTYVHVSIQFSIDIISMNIVYMISPFIHVALAVCHASARSMFLRGLRPNLYALNSVLSFLARCVSCGDRKGWDGWHSPVSH